MEPAHRCKPDIACRKGLIPGEGISVSLERPDWFLRSIAGRGRQQQNPVLTGCEATHEELEIRAAHALLLIAPTKKKTRERGGKGS